MGGPVRFGNQSPLPKDTEYFPDEAHRAALALREAERYTIRRFKEIWVEHNSKSFCRCEFCRIYKEVDRERIFHLR
jgi:hypothetical protein